MDLPQHPSGQSERELFIQAMDKATPPERAAYLNAACGNDIALRRRLDLLLERCEQVGTFLNQPVVSVAPANQPGLAEEIKTVVAPARLTRAPAL